MGRASDWSPVGMDEDPTPGDPERISQLADKLLGFAEDVADALRGVRDLSGDGALAEFVGETADAFAERFEDVPGNLTKLQDSYELAGQALDRYWPLLESAQRDADSALDDAEAAQADLASAQDWLSTAASLLETAEDDEDEEPEGPDEEQLRSEVRRAVEDATTERDNAQSAVDSAQSRLDAAILLAEQAKAAREEAASRCVEDLEEASDAGMQNKSWWEKVTDWVADNWDTIMEVVQVVATVLAIVALFVGGPLVWGLMLAASLIILADTLVKYANGEAGLLDVGFALLDCIPGGRLVGRGARFARTGLARTSSTVAGEADDVVRNARRYDDLVTSPDPVDFATGEVLLPATDVEFPGVLPLLIERYHRSTYRDGRWFGPTWASTLDQRLILDGKGVRFLAADAMTLHYPRPLPDPDAPVLPLDGPGWGLAWDGEPGGEMTIHQRETGRTLHFAPVPGHPRNELPLVAITDRNVNRIDIRYDKTGAPSEISHTGGYRIAIATYDERITSLRLISAPGEPFLIAYDYDASGHLANVFNSSGLPFQLTYDTEGRLRGWQDRNDTWYRYDYDTHGRCILSTGTDRAFELAYAYDSDNHTTTATTPEGHTTVYQFTPTYKLASITDPLGHTTHHEWDAHDRPTAVTDPLGRRTEYTWNDDGLLAVLTRPDGSTIHTEYNELGLPTEVVQPDGAVWRYAYDMAGNRTTTLDPAGHRTRYTHHPTGAIAKVTNALDCVTRIESNAAGLLTAVTAPSGAVTRYERDAFGRVVQVTEPTGGVDRWRWTIEGRPLRHTDQNDAVRSWTWDGEGNCLTHTDQNGGVTAYEYGAFDLPVVEIRPDGARYSFTHDLGNRVLQVTNAHGLTWDYERDPMGRVVRESDFDGRIVSLTYDAAGQLTSRTNALGQTLSLARDRLGRITEKIADGITTRFTYDPLGRLVGAVCDSDRPPADDDSDDLRLIRDAMGRVVAETVGTRTISSTYDELGRRISRMTPTGVDSTWTYTPFGAPATLTTAGRVLAFGYDAAGRETTRQISDALTLTHAWDPAGRLAEQRLSRGTLALQRRRYHWRPDNYLIGIHDADAGDTQYELDTVGRPLAVRSPSSTETYSYDPEGNQTSAQWSSTQTPTDACGRRSYTGMRLTSAGRVRYAYDDAGRTVSRQVRTLSGKVKTWQYSWDAEDRLTSVATPDGSQWHYHYDPLGRRISKRRIGPDGRLGQRTVFTWDGPVLAEQTSYEAADPKPTTLTWNHQAHHPLTQVERRGTYLRKAAEQLSDEEVDQRFYAIITDLVGTPTHLVGDTGEAAWHSNTALWGAGSPDEDARCPLRFPGQYADAETGWHYNLYRHYDPQVSRYTSPDPLGLDPAPNAYSYPHNPHTWTDPLGLLPCRQGARQQALRDAGVPDGAEPLDVRYTPSTSRGGRQVLDENYQPVYFREEVHLNNRDELIVYQDHHTGHQFPDGVGNQPPHVHVRPYDDPRNGQIPGCQEHYYYDPSLG
jgi:RHS repeat-associated protein